MRKQGLQLAVFHFQFSLTQVGTSSTRTHAPDALHPIRTRNLESREESCGCSSKSSSRNCQILHVLFALDYSIWLGFQGLTYYRTKVFMKQSTDGVALRSNGFWNSGWPLVQQLIIMRQRLVANNPNTNSEKQQNQNNSCRKTWSKIHSTLEKMIDE